MNAKSFISRTVNTSIYISHNKLSLDNKNAVTDHGGSIIPRRGQLLSGARRVHDKRPGTFEAKTKTTSNTLVPPMREQKVLVEQLATAHEPASSSLTNHFPQRTTRAASVLEQSLTRFLLDWIGQSSIVVVLGGIDIYIGIR
jgi:hypothetical protein